LIGGIFGAAGLWILPLATAHRWWWLPLIADLSIPGAIYALIVYGIFRRDADK
jgi:hypothetical protein